MRPCAGAGRAFGGPPFTLSWSHYVELMGIKDPDERSFYKIEAASEGWSLSELRRQKASALYHRLALSRDKTGVKRLAEKGQIQCFLHLKANRVHGKDFVQDRRDFPRQAGFARREFVAL